MRAAGAAAALLFFISAAQAAETRDRVYFRVAREARDLARGYNANLPAPAQGGPADAEPALRADLMRRMDALDSLMERLYLLLAGPTGAEYFTDLAAAKGLIRDYSEQKEAYSKVLAAYYPANIKAQGHAIGAGASPLDLDNFFRIAARFEDSANYDLKSKGLVYDKTPARTRAPSRAPWAAAAAVLAAGGLAWRLRRCPPPALPEPAAPAPEGPFLAGNYRVERELGRGGMGVVVQALDVALQRRVAIKRMRGDFGPDPHDAEQFLAEARLVAALQHPNIVKIHTFFKEGSELCLVFELLEGKTLSGRLAGGKALALPEARAILRQVAAALDYAHANKVIHRDLKPANIMLTPGGVAKVMDFGLAHQARHTAAQMTRAAAGGTFPYMAPEQELGEVSRQSDIFALGVCLYEMLTGDLPFPGPNFLAQKREKRFKPPSASGLPSGLDALLARALEPEPASRFSTASELARAVEAA